MINADENILMKRRAKCADIIMRMERVAVAFSAGVDSTFLLALCVEVLGSQNVLALVGVSSSLPQIERSDALQIAAELDVELVEVNPQELNDSEYAANTSRRCYHCKKHLYSELKRVADIRKIDFILNGANADDIEDYRPGMQAAAECGVRSPLLEAGLTKSDIRELSWRKGLKTWDKPAMACLASRIQYGQTITAGKLLKIEQSENYLRDCGFHDVRVRDHGNLARIEIRRNDFNRLLENAAGVVEHIKKTGFVYVSLDIEGFRSGSANEVLSSIKNTDGAAS